VTPGAEHVAGGFDVAADGLVHEQGLPKVSSPNLANPDDLLTIIDELIDGPQLPNRLLPPVANPGGR
jgi:hypothetical protein